MDEKYWMKKLACLKLTNDNDMWHYVIYCVKFDVHVVRLKNNSISTSFYFILSTNDVSYKSIGGF